MQDRKPLWRDLILLSRTCSPWVVMGDFNALSSFSEQKGAKSSNPTSMKDFNNCINDSHLTDAGFIGSNFTRACGNNYSRLDRVLCESAFLDLFPALTVRHLSRTNSDHSPLLINVKNLQAQNMWIHHEGLFAVVKKCWDTQIIGEPLWVLCTKLKALKYVLKAWNLEVFGNVTSMVESSEEAVQICEHNFESSGSEEDRINLLQAKDLHNKNLAIEEDFLTQKCGVRWIKEGDKSTAYFHSVLKQKHRKKNIGGTLVDGSWLTSQEDIKNSAVDYFQDIFTSNPVFPEDEDLAFDCIPSLVTEQQNNFLLAPPSLQEVKSVVFGMDKHSAAGTDGFNGVFFQHFWSIIDKDVHNAVLSFFAGTPLPKGMSSTVISLIPKCEGPLTWKQYRPISLCTFANKILSKIMNSRLALVLPSIISVFQAGFIHGRLIQDNILLAQELIHNIDHPVPGGNVVLKLDMSRAFDMLSWDFLKVILKKFGFSPAWINLVMNNINNSWFSILINGEAAGYFKSTKGIRQGDPLSPSLFILAEDYLLRSLAQLQSQFPSMAFNTKCKVIIPCLAFADDCLLFCNGSKSALKKTTELLTHYQAVSGQLINKGKSSYITSSKLNPARIKKIQLYSGFKKEDLPFNYLDFVFWRQDYLDPNCAIYLAPLLPPSAQDPYVCQRQN
ncbi:hypothetical protein LIER_37405 [Lithospermum erythrorhizon]|uniref:Reverse transcriptase domain-containing protein n=1 Tax=Lithospermum erythrorhizon TaxID=34254 RepID=A0AAV3PJV0_LITER